MAASAILENGPVLPLLGISNSACALQSVSNLFNIGRSSFNSIYFISKMVALAIFQMVIYFH